LFGVWNSCRFFEDAKEVLMVDDAAPPALRRVAERYLETIIIAYQAEARALDVCEIKVSTSTDNCLDIWIYRTNTNSHGDEPRLVTRGRLVTGGDVVEPDHSELLRKARVGASM
jgi:hypothetical protein